MRITLLTHGYPPRENAGTEQHCWQLSKGLQARGHQLQIIAATRAPGKQHTHVMKEYPNPQEQVVRIVNNIPARPLAQAEIEPSIEAIIYREIEAFQPDILHVHHLQFLSAGLRFQRPSLFSFHDGWAWCAAGGTELTTDGQICAGPKPENCAPCAASWQPYPTRTAQFLFRLAGHLNPWLASDYLHRMWQKLPPSIRQPIAITKHPHKVEAPHHARYRNEIMKATLQHFSGRVAPSQYLATKAEQMGCGAVSVIPHGTDIRRQHIGGQGLVFIGTIAHHKGPDLVSQAHRLACPNGDPPLRIFGPSLHGDLALQHPLQGPLDREALWHTLQHADALIMGSRWAENCPLIIIEAKAAGCPIIAPNIGGIPELVQHKVDGLLFPPDDLHALVDAIKQHVSGQPYTVRPPNSFRQQLDQFEQLYRDLQ